MATERTRRERSIYTHQGSYRVHTYNTLLGFQTGGKLEYRFCRWTPGYARQCRHVPELRPPGQRHPDRLRRAHSADVGRRHGRRSGAGDANNSFSSSSNVVAFAGGFGVAGSYKFLPNLVGHVSYDMTWVGDIARAPEQMDFASVPETASTATINTKGSVFYNGVSFGLEWDW